MPPNKQDIENLIDRHIKAWCAKSAAEVAQTYTRDAVFVINRGEPMKGHADIKDMVNSFCDAFPDVVLTLAHSFIAADHAVYSWTFTRTHVDTGKKVTFSGWEEWDLTDDCKVRASLGWFDAEDYERQLA